MSLINKDDLHRIFKNLDENNDGLIGNQELLHLLHKMGIQTTLEELEKLVGKKNLDYIEFLFFYDAMVSARMAQQGNDDDNDEDDLSKAFKVFDLNGDGFISSEELRRVLSRMGLLEKNSGQDCQNMIHVYDNNSDGVLDFEEFKKMMSVPTPVSDSQMKI